MIPTLTFPEAVERPLRMPAEAARARREDIMTLRCELCALTGSGTEGRVKHRSEWFKLDAQRRFHEKMVKIERINEWTSEAVSNVRL